MKRIFLAAIFFLQIAARAQSPVVLTIDAKSYGPAIPRDFIGLSFETSNLLPDKNGHHLFSAENKQLVNLFRNIGIKNLRVGGGTVDIPRYAVPGPADIDALFAFAKAADVRVIYSFRLLNGDKTSAAALAKYIWQNYQPQLDSFSIGNEPDWKAYHNKDPKITNYPSYLANWKDFAAAIIAAAPGSKFSGPDTGSNFPAPGATNTCFNGETWTRLFAEDEQKSRIISSILQHDYVGQNAKDVSISAAVDAMLSPGWVVENYPALYEHVLAPVKAAGSNFRMTECNDYVGGVPDASNAFAPALWALDYMHWWAAHGCAGVSFHNRKWIFTDTIYQDSNGDFRINPKAYGLKAFDLGSHGNVIASLKLSNPRRINVDCYAVGDSTNLFVTIINKTHGPIDGTNIVVTIRPKHFVTSAAEYVMLDSVPSGDCLAKKATLGGATITDGDSWDGQWTPLNTRDEGQCVLTLKPASAAVVHLVSKKFQ